MAATARTIKRARKMMNVTMMVFLSVLIEQGWDPHPGALFSFTRVNVFLLIVYLVEGGGTSVELHILTTHLHKGEVARTRLSAQGIG
jgi:hypothetical protein